MKKIAISVFILILSISAFAADIPASDYYAADISLGESYDGSQYVLVLAPGLSAINDNLYIASFVFMPHDNYFDSGWLMVTVDEMNDNGTRPMDFPRDYALLTIRDVPSNNHSILSTIRTIALGASDYTRSLQSQSQAEYDYLLDLIELANGELSILLDIETTDGCDTINILLYLDYVKFREMLDSINYSL